MGGWEDFGRKKEERVTGKKRIFIWGVVFRGERKAGSPAIAAKTARNLKSIGSGGEAQRRGDFSAHIGKTWGKRFIRERGIGKEKRTLLL